MLTDQKNSKKQGDVGLGAAIAWFTEQGYTVCIPLTDSQDYDLIVDNDDQLFRVQVKTTTFARRGKFEVQLAVKGGNRTSRGRIKPLDRDKVDAVFVLTGEGDTYFIPSTELRDTHSITLCDHYQRFRIE